MSVVDFLAYFTGRNTDSQSFFLCLTIGKLVQWTCAQINAKSLARLAVVYPGNKSNQKSEATVFMTVKGSINLRTIEK